MEQNIALIGNPNVGKTSLYNRVTKSFEHVGNWHGVTVSKVSKKISFEGNSYNITDLPGLYSLSVYSPEEGISRDAVYGGANNLIINVCETGNLSRNLYLTLQLIEYGAPVMLAINMIDELKKRGKRLKLEKLENALGIKILGVSAKYKDDAKRLLAAAVKNLAAPAERKPNLKHLSALPIEKIVSIIRDNAHNAGVDAEWAAVKVLENDLYIIERLALNDDQKKLIEEFGDTQPLVARARYEYIDSITQGLIEDADATENKSGGAKYVHGVSRIDRIALNKYLAFPVFLFVMAAVFFVTFGFVGRYLSTLLDWLIENALYNPINNGLTKIRCPDFITALICEGIILGVGGILTFLPQIVLLFFFLALLEDSGYISRVAFMTDGFFRKIGLSGRSSFTMLMGFGCSATAVLTARGLEDEATRKKTIMLTPFMSCSARLPVYSVIAGAFFSGGQPLIIFGMYILGIVVSVILAAILEFFVKPLKSGKLSFIMEMPPYRMPTFERVFQIIKNNVKVFLIRVGTVIFALNVIVWLLSNFSFTHGYVAGTEFKSIFEYISSFLAPLFAPLGFGNWKAVTALMSGVVAKEIVISSIESLGGVAAVFTGQYASAAALAFMVFTLLYVPCVATLAAIKKEVSAKFMLICLCVQLGTAYIFSLVFYWLARLYMHNLGLAVGITLMIIIAALIIPIIISIIRHPSKCSGCEGCNKKDCGKRNK